MLFQLFGLFLSFSYVAARIDFLDLPVDVDFDVFGFFVIINESEGFADLPPVCVFQKKRRIRIAAHSD